MAEEVDILSHVFWSCGVGSTAIFKNVIIKSSTLQKSNYSDIVNSHVSITHQQQWSIAYNFWFLDSTTILLQLVSSKANPRH